MMKDVDGYGPAFPVPYWPSPQVPNGMSLRTWLAGQALAGIGIGELDYGTVGKPTDPWPWVAEQCVKAADAIIAELAKEPPPCKHGQ